MTTFAEGTVGSMLSDEQRKNNKAEFLSFKLEDSRAVNDAIDNATDKHKENKGLWQLDIQLAVCSSFLFCFYGFTSPISFPFLLFFSFFFVLLFIVFAIFASHMHHVHYFVQVKEWEKHVYDDNYTKKGQKSKEDRADWKERMDLFATVCCTYIHAG